MFTYYGSKSKLVSIYPKPINKKIIEPFAGSARYSLRYFDNDVLLVDKYEIVVRIWKWLQSCSENDILKLPCLKQGDNINDIKSLSYDEKIFLGMLAGVASTSPRYKVSKFSASQNGRKNQLKRIADQLYKIRHWKIEHKCFSEIPNQCATWFIDPPYQHGGNAYVENLINYNELSKWSKSRSGQVIVCENTKADWMDFLPVKDHVGAMSTTREAIWTNLNTSYDVKQLYLFDTDEIKID